jgi:glyoxylase-like metal-dependent hydrolase (beta-lactamase superfamily II)
MNTYQTNGNANIYIIPVDEFPGLSGNVYVVTTDDYRVLVDTGSGFGESNHQLELGFEQINQIRGDGFSFKDLTHVFITHGHIDHFGGLPFIRERSDAKICIHELDRRIVSNHEERLSLAAHRLEEYLTEAGVSPEHRSSQIEMYKITKSLYRSGPVDLTYEACGMKIGPFEFFHVPGHCAGHVLIRLHDILFCGDHVLEKTSPHQAPEQITLSTGLETYLASLEKARKIGQTVKSSLGGHEDRMQDLGKRIDEIKKVHLDRLNSVLKYLSKPHTITEISKQLFGHVDGYTVLLALEEAGAHVEYLYQRGYLNIENLREIEESAELIPIKYQCFDCSINNI